jgi:hypothetical protein
MADILLVIGLSTAAGTVGITVFGVFIVIIFG